MTRVTENQVQEALRRVGDPAREGNVIDLGMIDGLVVRDGNVMFSIIVDPDRAPEMESLRLACEQVVSALPGALSVTAVLTAEQAPPHQPNNRLGLKVGILDADIYGPSMPRMLGISGQPRSDGEKLEPMRGHGVSCMSIGFLVDPDQPTIWRGPMVMGALEQLFGDVNWGELDVMLVDMPPGTGDAQLTMAQKVPLKGAIIVSTPQDIALIDARKGLNMFRQTDVPVMGLLENMSYFHCPHCAERSEIFGHGGARQTAKELECDFLGEIPLHISLRETSDAGTPIMTVDPSTPHAEAFLKIAKEIKARV